MKRSIALYSAMLLAALSYFSLTDEASAQLVVNGGFESGDFNPGWTFTDLSDFTFVNNDSSLAHTGNDFAFLGASPDPGSLLQTLTTTQGQTYQLSFWLASDRTGTVSNSFQVLWNNVSVLSLTDVPAPGFSNPYVNFTISNLSAAGATSTLEFVYRNDDDFFRLDDVSVTQSVVPEISATAFAMIGFAFLGLVFYRRHKASSAA